MKIKLLFFFVLNWQTGFSQSFYNAAEDYFRSSPFNKPFNEFTYGLMKDPALVEKKINKKTDSTLFFLQGKYFSYSPFFIPLIQCKIILAEREEFLDSLSADVYTYFVYQVIGNAAAGENGRKDVKEEFEKLNRKFSKKINTADKTDLKTNNQQSGMLINYRYKKFPFFPLSIAWTSSDDMKENRIIISMRFYVMDNKAYLPISANSF